MYRSQKKTELANLLLHVCQSKFFLNTCYERCVNKQYASNYTESVTTDRPTAAQLLLRSGQICKVTSQL